MTAIAVFRSDAGVPVVFPPLHIFEPDEGIAPGCATDVRGRFFIVTSFRFSRRAHITFWPWSLKSLAVRFWLRARALIFFGGIYSAVTYLLAQTGLFARERFVRCRHRAAPRSALSLRGSAQLGQHSVGLPGPVLRGAMDRIRLTARWAFGVGSLAALTFSLSNRREQDWCSASEPGLAAITMIKRDPRLWQGSQFFMLAAGFGWPFLLTFAYFGAQHSTGVMLADWLWPLRHYSLANHVPYGYQNWSDSTRHLLFGSGSLNVRLITIVAISPCFLVPLLPLSAVALLFYWIVQMLGKRSQQTVASYYVLVCAAIGGLLVSVIVGRADIIHFMYLLPLFALVLAWMIDGRDIPGRAFSSREACFCGLRGDRVPSVFCSPAATRDGCVSQDTRLAAA